MAKRKGQGRRHRVPNKLNSASELQRLELIKIREVLALCRLLLMPIAHKSLIADIERAERSAELLFEAAMNMADEMFDTDYDIDTMLMTLKPLVEQERRQDKATRVPN